MNTRNLTLRSSAPGIGPVHRDLPGRPGLQLTVPAADPPLATASAAAGALWGADLVGRDDRVDRSTDVTLARSSTCSMTRLPACGSSRGSRHSGHRGQRHPPGWPPPTASDRGGLAPDRRLRGRLGSCRAASICRPPRLCSTGSSGPARRSSPAAVRLAAGGRRASPAAVIVDCAGSVRTTGAQPAHDTGARPGSRRRQPAGSATSSSGPVTIPMTSVACPAPGHRGPRRDPATSDWALEPDQAIAERIVRRCVAIEPRLAGADIIAHRVGLRPVRPSVRLETEDLGRGRRLLHNYGHGEAGITLSWGCAPRHRDRGPRLTRSRNAQKPGNTRRSRSRSAASASTPAGV